MKYGDLIQRKTIDSLMMISFDTPEINLWAYKFCKTMIEQLNFVESERIKAVTRYGEKTENGGYQVTDENMPKFYETMQKLYDMELDVEFPYYPITEDNFSNDRCCYPADKQQWLNASGIASIMNFIEHIKIGKEPV